MINDEYNVFLLKAVVFPENIRKGVIGGWDSVLLTYLNKSWKLFETCLLTLLVLSTSNHVWLKTIFPEIRDIKILCSIYSKLILISSKILCVTGHEIVSGTRLAPSVKDVFSKQSQNTYQSRLAPYFPPPRPALWLFISKPSS